MIRVRYESDNLEALLRAIFHMQYNCMKKEFERRGILKASHPPILFMSCNLGIITETFPVKSRARALSSISSAVALGMLAGPIAGGFILSYFSWKVIFLVNLPIGAVAFLLGLLCLPKSGGERTAERFDLGGAILIVLAVAALISSLTMMPGTGSNPAYRRIDVDADTGKVSGLF